MNASCVPISGVLGHVIVNSNTKKKTKKNGDFWLKNLLIRLHWYNSNTIIRAQLKIVHNVGNYKWFLQTEFEGTRSRDQNVTGRK